MMLYNICKSLDLNFGRIIWIKILAYGHKNVGRLFFSSMIMNIYRMAEVEPEAQEEREIAKTTIDASLIRRLIANCRQKVTSLEKKAQQTPLASISLAPSTMANAAATPTQSSAS